VTSARPVLLVARALGLGDLLTAVPAIRGLRRAFAEHELVLATPSALTPIADLIGGVDRIVATRPLRTPRVWRPDVAVNLHGKGPQSHACLLRMDPSRLIAFEHPEIPESWGAPAWMPEEHEVARWCRLLTENAIACELNDLGLSDPGISREHSGVTVVHPGAGSGARCWPPERWAKVVEALVAAGHHVAITGGASEQERAQRVAGSLRSEVTMLAGGTDLRALARIVSHARLIVSADTGIAHLAVAFDTSSVTLFGPTPPALWGPPADRAQHRVLWKGERGDPLGAHPDPFLLAITVDEVVGEVMQAALNPA
jgi:ADP-heptose:LPS heptosyltransferase